jgi:hypothetical protein
MCTVFEERESCSGGSPQCDEERSVISDLLKSPSIHRMMTIFSSDLRWRLIAFTHYSWDSVIIFCLFQ